MQFPHLFQPLQVGHLRLKNRIIMGSMQTGLEDQAQGFEKLARFYAERAHEGPDLIVTGGFGPNPDALGRPEQAQHSCLYLPQQVAQHRLITEAVHREGGHVLLQILHAGRYDLGTGGVPSRPGSRSAQALTHAQILQTIDDYLRCARLARDAGYDGVEIMGGEGYLINQFLAPCTNRREDQWGGDANARSRFALCIVQGIRQAVTAPFVVGFRLSLMDLVEDGCHWSEVVQLAQQLEAAGVDLFNTSIGWPESRVPTVAMVVPRAAFGTAVERLKQAVAVPVAASHRINTPQVADHLIAQGQADMVAIARPLLADPAFVRKARVGDGSAINTCVACNQSCLDQIARRQPVSCLVNPRACQEWAWPLAPAPAVRSIAVLGAGPAGLACAREAAARGHAVTLFDRSPRIGGQLNLARLIPGKQEMAETLRYFQREITRLGITLQLGTPATLAQLRGFDHIVVATGAVPRRSGIAGENSAEVFDYVEAIRAPGAIGARVAVVGAGPVGFDVAELLSHPPGNGSTHSEDPLRAYRQEWGVDPLQLQRGGLHPPLARSAAREIWLLQRSPSLPGSQLAATTGWIRRARLDANAARMFNDVQYLQIDDHGLHLSIRGERRCLRVDSIVVCAGQQSHDPWSAQLLAQQLPHSVIGGARDTHRMDAARAIREGAELGRQL